MPQISEHWNRLDLLAGVVASVEPVAAVLVPVYLDQQENARLVLTKRPRDMRTHPGDVVFPGGRIEGRESAVETAIREAGEEIGLQPNSIDVVGQLSPVSTRNPSDLIVPIVAKVVRPDAWTLQTSEVDLVLEPTVDELADSSRWRTAEWHGRTMWFYEFPEATLWGATALMVRELLDLLDNQD